MTASRFLKEFSRECREYPNRIAYFTSRGEAADSINYGDLDRKSNALAAFLKKEAPQGKPIVVYGHKSPLMLVSFLAAA